MTIRVQKTDLLSQDVDLLVVGEFRGLKRGSDVFLQLDKALGGILKEALTEDGWKGEVGEPYLLRTHGKIPAKRVVIVGLGAKDEFTEEYARQAAAAALNAAKTAHAGSVVMRVFEGGKLNPRLVAKAMTEGIELANYQFGRYKKESGAKAIEKVTLLVSDAKSQRLVEEGVELGGVYARATILARDLVNTPGQHMTPANLVDAAKEAIKGKKGMKMRVYGRDELAKMGANGVLGIAQGSDHEPFLVHMTYTPSKPSKKSVAIVGKAVTFDSGGLSLKPADAMATMKLDMAGAADVIGLFSELSDVKPRVTVHGIFAACENMPSGKAIRPGDVVEIMNGKTIEILNTDAEGRVTLADALTYAVKQKPSAIVDLATLTGACMVALGEEITGLMSNNRPLARAVLGAAEAAGEKMWELPLDPVYKPLIRSDVADYKNIAGRYGGALTAGLLLEEFVDGIAWVHLDIAGPSFAERPMGPYMKRGATGHGVRTLIEWLRGL